MNKILSNQIITDCDEFSRDLDAGVYDGLSEKALDTYLRITEKFHELFYYDEIPQDDIKEIKSLPGTEIDEPTSDLSEMPYYDDLTADEAESLALTDYEENPEAYE